MRRSCETFNLLFHAATIISVPTGGRVLNCNLPETSYRSALPCGGTACCPTVITAAQMQLHISNILIHRSASLQHCRQAVAAPGHVQRQPCRTVAVPATPQQKSAVETTSTSSKQPSSEPEQDPAYKYSDGVNQFLGNFLPSNKAAREELSVDFCAPKLTGISIDELAKLVEQGLSKTQWFVTGEVDARLFADNFAFKDESVATTGIKAYATGVRKLFDQVRLMLVVLPQCIQGRSDLDACSSDRHRLLLSSCAAWELAPADAVQHTS